MVHSKRLGYQNSYAEDLRLSLHTDNPQLLQLPKLLYVIGPQQREGLRVNFQPKPRTMVRHCCHYRCAFPRQSNDCVAFASCVQAEQHAEVRLWVHNERTDENEECIVFHVTYLNNFEADIVAR